jgi:HPt (histidine-containing phosphotransfer) domain-containing protein
MASLRKAITEGLAVAGDRTPLIAAAQESPRLAELVEILGEAVVREILAMFAADTRANLTAMLAAAGRGESEEVCRLAHSVTGAARNVGATELAAGASALEAQAGSLRVEAMAAKIVALQAALDSFLMQVGITPDG